MPWAELVGFSHSFMHAFIQSTSVSRLLCMGTVASLWEFRNKSVCVLKELSLVEEEKGKYRAIWGCVRTVLGRLALPEG